PLPSNGKGGRVGQSVVSSEVAGQLLPLDQKPRRAPVGTSDRLFGGLEVDQQAALLGHIEHVPELHRGMACDRRGSLLDGPVAAMLGERRQRFLDRRRRATRRKLNG